MLAVGRGLKPRSPGCCFTTVRVFILQLLDVVSVTKQITLAQTGPFALNLQAHIHTRTT